MIDVLCVCKSGGIYDTEWVRKLKEGFSRNFTFKHRFRCLSDIEVPCDRIPLQHDWPGWWAKIEMFRKGVIEGPTLYLDLDTVITGEVNLARLNCDFAMLRNFWVPDMVGSGVMWFSGENVPHKVYDKFIRQPLAYMAHHKRHEDPPYIGDQAFVWDALNREVEQVNDYLPGIYSYKMHCLRRLPADASIICFHGLPRPTEVNTDWMQTHWHGARPITESDIA